MPPRPDHDERSRHATSSTTIPSRLLSLPRMPCGTRAVIERARGVVAKALGAMPSEIVFTGSGSEADNHAVIGAILSTKKNFNSGKNIVFSSLVQASSKIIQ